MPRSRTPTRRAIPAILAATALVAVGCSPATPDPSPPGAQASARSPGSTPDVPGSRASATPAVSGLSWIKATDVARPDEAFADASAAPTVPTGPGTAGHPGHFPGQAIVDDIAQAGERLVAVGYVGVRGSWTAVSWTSDDGDHWSLGTIDDAPGSVAVSLAVPAGPGSNIVAAGRSGSEPVAWVTPDGRAWTRRTVPTLSGGSTWERIVTVLATDEGLVAGGSAGPELGERHARFWRSADGTAWEPVPDDPDFAGAEVVSIVARDGGFVALGRLGTGQRGSGSIAWVSNDGNQWQRIASGALASGLVAAVAKAPDGTLVAVGSDLDERAALVWRSADGTAWDLAPAEDSRLYNGDKIRMTDIEPLAGRGLVAVGNYVGVQYGTASSWTSADGLTWRRAPRDPALEQGEMLSVAVGRSGLVSAGSFGAPDNYIPTIWRGPLPNGG